MLKKLFPRNSQKHNCVGKLLPGPRTTLTKKWFSPKRKSFSVEASPSTAQPRTRLSLSNGGIVVSMVTRVPVILPTMMAVAPPVASVALSQNVLLKEFPSADKATASMIRVGPEGQHRACSPAGT